jgi:hypothetical protein
VSDRYTFDLDVEHPNVDIDGLRRATKQAIADLAAAVTDVEGAQAGVDDAYWLSDLLFSQLDAVLAEMTTNAAERQQLRADLDALTARVAALEPPPADPPLEVP